MRKEDPEKINFILGEEESGFKTIKIRQKAGGARKFGAGAIWRRASWELSVTPLPFLPAPYHTSLP